MFRLFEICRLWRFVAVWIGLAAWCLLPAFAQESASQIRDIAGMFDLETVRKARTKLDQIERDFRVPILIETVDSLNGEPVNDVAERRDRQWGHRGIYVLMSKENRRISRVIVGGRLADRLPEPRLEASRNAFIADFKKADFDAGLEHGIMAIERMLSEARVTRSDFEKAPAHVEGASSTNAPDTPFVLHNQVRITLAGARRVVAEAEAKATQMKLKVNIAVVDDGGHLIAFARMDGARPASVYTALTKATTAATFRQPTGPIPPGTSAPDLLLNLSLQNAAAASGGKLTTLPGGVPIMVDGQVIGGVGVGGGTGEQDAEVAKAGISALIESINEDKTGDK